MYVHFSFVDDFHFNYSYNDGITTPMIHPQPIDPKDRKRQLMRDRYANMDSMKKDDLLKRQRETRQKRKSTTIPKDNVVLHEDSELLIVNGTRNSEMIHMTSQEQVILPTGMDTTNSC